MRCELPAVHLGRIVLATCTLTACAASSDVPRSGAERRAPAAFPVEVETAGAREVEYEIAAVGSVEAFETVQVVARVPGTVERVEFQEGSAVEAGRTLAVIEPERYRIEVDSARAAHARAAAELADSRAGLARRERGNLERPALFPEEDVETYRTRVLVAEASVAERRAALARAELNLRDAHVRAPAAGRIESRTVQTGQYVQVGTVLATLVRREPLLLRFDVSEPETASLRDGMPASFRVAGGVESYAAEISHVGGAADPASRMVTITARVTDERRATLLPGAFAEVSVPIGRGASAPVIPQTAIRPSERGFLAFVVEDGVARERVLTLGLRTADGRVEVRDGLAAGETLVVRGAEALADGAAVVVEARP